MPTIPQRATLNGTMIDWCEKYCPDWLASVTGQEFRDLLDEIIDVQDVYIACKLVERATGTNGNEDLIIALMYDPLRRY